MPKVEPTPDGREISIPTRQARFLNLNSKPEQHGTEKQPRNDLSIEFTLSASQAGEIIDFDGNIESLWNKNGEPRFREILDPLLLGFKARGIAKLGPARDDTTEFDATLKKVAVLLVPESKLTVFAQLRIDPTGHTEWLTRAQCAGTIKFGFKGKVLVKTASDEDDDADGKKPDQQLPLGSANGHGPEVEAPGAAH
jgi:hypothetical protein